MKLKDFVLNLVEELENNPESGELLVVTSSDDEGNGFNEVYYEPTIGYYEYNKFRDLEDYKDLEFDENQIPEFNAICVN